MIDRLTARLNQILPRLCSDDFLSGRGLGNEIAVHVFDYPPEDELRIRDHIRFLLEQVARKRPELRVRHVSLFELIVEYLEERNFLHKGFELQCKKGDDALLTALAAPLQARKLAPVFHKAAQPEASDLVLVSGVGSAWPLLRTHSLLANRKRPGAPPLMGDGYCWFFWPGEGRWCPSDSGGHYFGGSTGWIAELSARVQARGREGDV